MKKSLEWDEKCFQVASTVQLNLRGQTSLEISLSSSWISRSIWCFILYADAVDILTCLSSICRCRLRLIPQTASLLCVLLHRTTNHPAAEPTCRERRRFIDSRERQPSWSVRCLPEIQHGKLGVALHMGSVKCGLSLWEVESEVFGYLAAAEADCCIDFT